MIVHVDAEGQGAVALERLFVLVKGLARPWMQQKGCQVWIVWSAIDDVQAAGADALVKVAAMELARKKVSLNFLRANSENARWYEQLLRTRHLDYITAQSWQVAVAEGIE
jgi:hypothetical protein